jgi:hypothetical protein
MNRTFGSALEQAPSLACEPSYDYSLYGLRLRSQTKLTLDDIPQEDPPDVELSLGTEGIFADATSQVTFDRRSWIHQHELASGWSYLRFDGLFEFLVSPRGNRIIYGFLGAVPLESFQTYALGRVISFALVKMGCEPLHAAAVVVDGRAVAFMGASSFGKSSLAACFVADGYRLLTDDVLRLDWRGSHYVAFPGPPRLKLLPSVARKFVRGAEAGVVMNPREAHTKSPKRVFLLSPTQCVSTPVPLGAIYAVTAPREVYRKQQIKLGALSPLQALVKVLAFTHNDKLIDSNRLTRQLDAARRLIAAVPVRSLAYPRVLASLTEVKDALLADFLTHYADPI